MSSQSYIFNPTERTLAAAGDGFSCPRLTTAGRTALSLTAGDKGMMVYDTTLTTLCIWNGTAWEFVSDNTNGFLSLKDFGAVGDGITDDTAAVNAAFAYCNANPNTTLIGPNGTYLVGKLTIITASNTTLMFDGVIFKSKPNTLILADDAILSINANNFTLIGLTIDGNQFNYTASCDCQLINSTNASNYHRFENVTAKNSCGRGAFLNASNSSYFNCNIDDNAGLGMQIATAAYITFVSCTWNRNGYGFKNTLATNAFIGFGFAIRYKSHHITFTNCQSNDCGRDGMNVNQGSYKITFVGCQCLNNNDGGFTVASDAGVGPGAGQACWDLQFIGCEAANSYTSGLAIYQSANNVTVIGGNYYNNNRVAGTIAQTSAFYNGIFVAAGSKAIIARGVQCFDDRQTRIVTASVVGGGQATVTATGWLAGTASLYPRVGLYDTTGAFAGYGNIVSESAGSVVITSSAFNGVNLALIAANWYITQAVQHNGLLMDNGAIGSIDVVGSGNTVGPDPQFQGTTVNAGSFYTGQGSVQLVNGVLGITEMLVNPSFEAGIANWAFSGAGATHQIVAPLKSVGRLQVIPGGAYVYGEATLVAGALNMMLGQFVQYSGWVYNVTKDGGRLLITWQVGASFYTSEAIAYGYGWQYVSLCVKIPSNASLVAIRVSCLPNTNASYDELSLRTIQVPNDTSNIGLLANVPPY